MEKYPIHVIVKSMAEFDDVGFFSDDVLLNKICKKEFMEELRLSELRYEKDEELYEDLVDGLRLRCRVKLSNAYLASK